MRNLATAFWLLAFTAAAFAQQTPPEVTIKLTPEKLNVLAQALEAMPYKVAAPMINDINQQIKAQMQPAPAAAAPAEAK